VDVTLNYSHFSKLNGFWQYLIISCKQSFRFINLAEAFIQRDLQMRNTNNLLSVGSVRKHRCRLKAKLIVN